MSLMVPGFFGGSTPMYALGQLELKSSAVSIGHVDRKHVVTVMAEAAYGSPVALADDVAERLVGLSLRRGEELTFLGDKARITEAVDELRRAMGIAVLLIFSILVVQFRSFTQPLLILISMPLAMTGVFLGFWVSSVPISFPSMIGMVALTGIVVNDAIVLVDCINRCRRDQGMTPLEAARVGTRTRLRPILVTTITTVIGLVPLALTDEVWEGLCLAVIYGITAATVLTLVVIPAFYLLLEDRGSARTVPEVDGR